MLTFTDAGWRFAEPDKASGRPPRAESSSSSRSESHAGARYDRPATRESGNGDTGLEENDPKDAAGSTKEVEKKNDPLELAECAQSMRTQLRRQVPNVFHYPQERWLFREGERQRGLTARRMLLAEEASGIEHRLNVAAAKRFERPVKILLGLFGFFSLAELLSWTNQAFHVERRFWAWVELGALALALLVVGFIYWRSIREEPPPESG